MISNTEDMSHFITSDTCNAMGTIKCPNCTREVDPTICWCGDPIDEHTQSSTHGAVPMGCICLDTRWEGQVDEPVLTAKETFPETDWDIF